MPLKSIAKRPAKSKRAVLKRPSRGVERREYQRQYRISRSSKAAKVSRPQGAFSMFAAQLKHQGGFKGAAVAWKALTEDQREEWRAKSQAAIASWRSDAPDWVPAPSDSAGPCNPSHISESVSVDLNRVLCSILITDSVKNAFFSAFFMWHNDCVLIVLHIFVSCSRSCLLVVHHMHVVATQYRSIGVVDHM